MKQATLALALLISAQTALFAQTTITFENATDLETYFQGTFGQFSQSATGGLNNSGSVDLNPGMTDLYTFDNSFLPGSVGTVYTVSAYLYNVDNSGFGGLGFTTTQSPEFDYLASPATGLGMCTHAGGGYTISNQSQNNFDYVSDQLLANHWYLISFSATVVGANTYDLSYSIANSDAAGNAGAPFIVETQSGVANAQFGAATAIYPYFCSSEDRFYALDNFTVQNSTLPIQLASLTAISSGSSTVTVQWKTISEINNYGFNVQRSAATGTPQWSTLGFVKGNGTTLSSHTYDYVDNTATGTFMYRLQQIDLNNTVHYSEPVSATTTGVSSTEPLRFGLEQNFPNPFNPTTEIHYTIAGVGHDGSGAANVRLAVYDVLGREVAVLVNEKQAPGVYSVRLNGVSLPSGIYIYRLTAGTFTAIRKMNLVK